MESNGETMNNDEPRRSGFAALIGAPNAGKSTLLNRMLGEKLSIVSPRAQTTRMRVLGIMTEGNLQACLLDTPGIFTAKQRFDEAMVKAAWDGTDDADAVVMLVDASARHADEKADAIVAELLRLGRKAILALNKIDEIKPAQLLPLAAKFNDTGAFESTFMISAKTGEGVDDLKRALFVRMPIGEWLFPQDQLTDLPERLLAAETTREQLFLRLRDELPYSCAVLPEDWKENPDGSVSIAQTIVVSRPNHRGIVLGKGGAMIKSIGQASRQELGKILDRRVHLMLEVKCDEDWREKGAIYQLLGLLTAKKQ